MLFGWVVITRSERDTDRLARDILGKMGFDRRVTSESSAEAWLGVIKLFEELGGEYESERIGKKLVAQRAAATEN